MSHIDTNYYVKIGGDIRRPPYIDTIGRGIYRPEYYAVRVFVSDLWYPDWESWSKAAEIAKETAILGTNPIINQAHIKIVGAIELDPQPSYIFDRSMGKFGTISILLNVAAIDNEREYDAIRIVAEARRRVVEKGLMKKNALKDEYTQYSPGENGIRYVWDDIKDSDSDNKRNLSRLFDDPDPWEQRREQLIQEFMRLDMDK